MSLVKFAMVCERCNVRGHEYESLPICETCERDICDNCTAETLTDWDVNHCATVVCADCKKEEDAA